MSNKSIPAREALVRRSICFLLSIMMMKPLKKWSQLISLSMDPLATLICTWMMFVLIITPETEVGFLEPI